MDNRHIHLPPTKRALFVCLVVAAVVLTGAVGTWAAELPAGETAPAPRVKAVLVDGNQRVDESTIRFHITTREGDPFSVYAIREDLKKIYGLGYFEDVTVDVAEYEGGLKVIYKVVEKPSLRTITVSGNDKIPDEDIFSNIPLREGAILNRSLVQESITVIQFLYHEKGHLFVKVEPLYHASLNNYVDLELKVTEGKKAFVETISFTGNRSFSDKELHKVIDTGTWSPLSFVTLGGTYVRDVVKNDRVKLIQFYHNNGFADVVIGEPAVEIDDKEGRIFVTFPTNEGLQYRVASLKIEGDEDVPKEQLLNSLSLKEGDIFRRNRLRRDVLNLTNFYSVQGYAYADVAPMTSRHPETKTVDIVLEVDKGQRVFVEQINIQGNTRTRDHVIRRQFKLSEGEVFDSSKLARSRRNVQYTGFFEEVSINTSPGSQDDTIIIDAEVQEKPTGVFGIGAGYSSTESGLLAFRIQQDNLGGRGQKLSFRGQFSGIRQRFRLNFWEPSVADSTIGMGFGLTNLLEEFPLYDTDVRGADVSVAKDFRDLWKGSLSYRYQEIEVKNVNSGVQDLIAEGTSSVGALRPTLTYTSLDSRFFPHSGSKQVYYLDLASQPIGSDVEFWKVHGDWRRYFEVKENVVYQPRVRMGFAGGLGGEELPAFERYFVGGTSTVRGFKLRDIGPGIGTGRSRRALGGDARFVLNNQVRYPLVDMINLSGVVFLDAGNVYSEYEDFNPFDLRYGTGAGVRLLSPIGPLGLDYGVKIDRLPGEDIGEFHLSLGSQF
ncbi:outer membrane protein assembly factor BamA [Nitrospinae bacterium AH-259-F20]|nr:outer membrane protein assembly factor BamA [Nitrospinae bacterium AH-259-F20]